MTKFLEELERKFDSSKNNHFGVENYDPYFRSLFGVRQTKRGLVRKTKDLLLKLEMLKKFQHARKKKLFLSKNVEVFEFLYSLLEDGYSRQTLVDLVAYLVLGREKVKLNLNSTGFWAGYASLDNLANRDDFIDSHFLHNFLYAFDLSSLGYPLKLHGTIPGINNIFLLKQYEYSHDGNFVGVKPGDYVVDAGACWGDSVLFFSHRAGPTGRVFAFDISDENIKILKRNLDQNYCQNVDIISLALDNISGRSVSIDGSGPATSIKHTEVSSESVGKTITLDDFVKENGIKKIDFIKMDIEGSEVGALLGAKAIIKRNKPRMAISAYHRLGDYAEIPKVIKSFDPSYRFCFDHFTIHTGESVIFCW